MFRDEVTIETLAGHGGDGLASFRREAHVPRGGPDGGDGGDGGSVILVVNPSLNSLLRLGRQYRYAARNGQPGGPCNRSGKSASELVIEVPVGTQVFDAERGNMLRDLASAGDRLVIAKGGRGGRGNTHFATSVRQVPRQAGKGKDGEQRRIRLELKLVAEVGLVGLPNAGKSTFLSVVTAATPKIADYPFTTLSPQVGIARVGDYDTLCIADLPGLIEGAAAGAGLGHRFLKHVERCSLLLHLVDVSEGELEPTLESLRSIESELERFSPRLAAKPRLVVASKCEDETARAAAEALADALGRPVFPISSLRREGIEALLAEARRRIRGAQDAAGSEVPGMATGEPAGAERPGDGTRKELPGEHP